MTGKQQLSMAQRRVIVTGQVVKVHHRGQTGVGTGVVVLGQRGGNPGQRNTTPTLTDHREMMRKERGRPEVAAHRGEEREGEEVDLDLAQTGSPR